jgi:hypothetical protein
VCCKSEHMVYEGIRPTDVGKNTYQPFSCVCDPTVMSTLTRSDAPDFQAQQHPKGLPGDCHRTAYVAIDCVWFYFGNSTVSMM